MARKRYTTEQIIGFLREAEVRLAQEQVMSVVCRGLGITDQTYYRWRCEYGGLKLDHEQENSRLKRAVSELTVDKLILKEAFGGKY